MPSAGVIDVEDETELLVRARRGDHGAFATLVQGERPRLHRLLYRITRDREAAEDALQEALTSAWLNLARFEGRARFSTWLTRIAINEAHSRIRRAQPETLELDDRVGERVPGWGDQPDAVFETREFLAAVDRALAELPPDYRSAVILRDVEGLSSSQAAEILGIGERALKSRVHRGRLALRAKLDGHFDPGAVG